MWIPKTEDEIVSAVTSGSLEETTIFDAKKEIPSKNVETAKDIAAMATNGGVIIYGIDEDENKRPTVLNPISLANQPERITSIVRTSIAEPPEIQIKPIHVKDDPSKGYLVVIVPPSPRAPHMVIVKGENRYYGRAATGNTPLTEAEVARLYERRQQWEVDRDKLLDEGITSAPIPPYSTLAYLHLVVRPVIHSDGLLRRAAQKSELAPEDLLYLLVSLAKKPSVYPTGQYKPDFDDPNQWLIRTDGYYGEMGGPLTRDWNVSSYPLLNIQIDFDGSAHLFCSRAAIEKDGRLFTLPYLVAGNVTRFVAFLGELCDRADYIGMVDFGVAITGLKGSIPYLPGASYMRLVPYDREQYRRTGRFSAIELKSGPIEVARTLLMPLFNAMTQGTFDPFKPRRGA